VKLVLAALAAAGAVTMAAAPPAARVAEGARAFQKCYSCHSVKAGETGLSGPNLRGIVGRPIAAELGFDYSAALRRLGRRQLRWTPARLDRFLADPEAFAPGTSMTFHMPSACERADLIAWLGTRR